MPEFSLGSGIDNFDFNIQPYVTKKEKEEIKENNAREEIKEKKSPDMKASYIGSMISEDRMTFNKSKAAFAEIEQDKAPDISQENNVEHSKQKDKKNELKM